MGEGRLAIEVHEALDPVAFGALLPERRANHCLDIARAYALVGDVGRASEVLLEADRLASAEIRCRPLAREVLSDILRRTRGTAPPAVTELAEDMGLGA
jgi:hypothetical protein